ncbi:hypothetical protein G647_01501 [Cladophialophora carrionii CBS 160.54]|uniref:Ribosome biogenesis protein SLX9 n=1 Tax=Cladophialophora carrionii CBS 160.54 TaxID=1279043 RepID=V9DRW2_9EURO|nr:uncharacterized protein G647_01501 [Cladophialophora carrionii CBS 160.54]ETI29048.1 hypothetical protein G647_01501 [Cladophialophora carrionii CBS 160.54]
MAPLRQPSSRNAQPTKSILKNPSNHSSQNAAATSGSLFPSSKKDKRRIKHAQLIHKVTKSSERKPKRRRPNKKLVTTLDALADALPHSEETGDDLTETKIVTAGKRPQDQVNIIKRKSIKSRPGAMKRRENVDRGERDRFAKNMAQLASASSDAAAGKGDMEDDGSVSSKPAAIPSTSERWAALRGFISQTLETKPELKALKT